MSVGKDGATTVTSYSLPKGSKNLTELIRRELKSIPCADAASVAARLPIRKRKIVAGENVEAAVARFFSLHIVPRPFPDSVRLDATEYEVQFVGDDYISIETDDYDSPIAQWTRSFEHSLTAEEGEGTP